MHCNSDLLKYCVFYLMIVLRENKIVHSGQERSLFVVSSS